MYTRFHKRLAPLRKVESTKLCKYVRSCVCPYKPTQLYRKLSFILSPRLVLIFQNLLCLFCSMLRVYLRLYSRFQSRNKLLPFAQHKYKPTGPGFGFGVRGMGHGHGPWGYGFAAATASNVFAPRTPVSSPSAHSALPTPHSPLSRPDSFLSPNHPISALASAPRPTPPTAVVAPVFLSAF